ncbi:MAG: hypothetical protein GX633_02870 [Clostridiales bacterium]|nr:hypothetical protein [Clostridiales bacterium]
MEYSKDFIISGIHVGEHSFEPEAVIREIKERCIDRGMNFVTIRTNRETVPAEYFYKWAEFLRDNKIYFIFLYTIQHAPAGRVSQLTKEIVSGIKEIAGEYFLGDMIGEVGSSYACKLPGYYIPGREEMPKQNARDMQEAKDNYIKKVSTLIEIDKGLGIEKISSVEATVLNSYNLEAGVTIPMCELMCGNPEIVVSALRGSAKAYSCPIWGTYIAHEWYGGLRHEDILKRKRLNLAYRYAYMAGSNVFCLESGDEEILSYNYQFTSDHELCKEYASELRSCAELIRSDARPAGGPIVKVAFAQGNLDSYGVWGASSVWSQFDRPEWSYGAPEQSWRIFDEIGTRRAWSDVANYGEQDLSALPAYGIYDIIPATAGAEAMKRYEYLIFTGWNTMTEEIYSNLEAYVENGGNLVISAAHLNTDSSRIPAFSPVRGGKLSRLLGCELTGDIIENNYGVKFVKESLNPYLLYPYTENKIVDPIYSAGNVRYASVKLTDGRQAAYLSDTFFEDSPGVAPAIVENRFGKGRTIFLTSLDYPGSYGAYPLYRAVVREIISSSARECNIKVICTDRVRYSVYILGDEKKRAYLLNTDYDLSALAVITKEGEKREICLEPLELRAIDI